MITSLTNDKVKFVRALQTRRRTREKEGRFIIEGVRLAEEVIRAKAPAELVLYVDRLDARGRAALNGLRQLGAAAEEVSGEVMAACTSTETPPGLLAVIRMPSLSSHLPPPTSGLALVIDRLADPGNLGAILRTAAAAGVEAVYLSPGTVDAYNPKVVRAAMGAHFHVPIHEADWPDIRAALGDRRVYLAAALGGQRFDQVDWTPPAALILGGEAEGASAEAEQAATGRVTIPMPGGSESLNAAVAAGILMFEAVRRAGMSIHEEA
jgi:TrmH family RNA methyltransferase